MFPEDSTLSFHFINSQKFLVMTFSVSDNILKNTTECPEDFSCLEVCQCGNRSMCIVDYIDGLNVLFLKTKKEGLFV